jgi:hypothetical protein
MGKKLWLLIIMIFVLVFGQSSFVLADSKTITLGHLNAFSGGASLYGKDSKRAMTLAVEEINGKGGVTVGNQRYMIEVKHLDNKYKAEATLAAYRRLVDLYGIHIMHVMGGVPTRAVINLNEKDEALIDVVTPIDEFTTSGNKLVISGIARTNGWDLP